MHCDLRDNRQVWRADESFLLLSTLNNVALITDSVAFELKIVEEKRLRDYCLSVCLSVCQSETQRTQFSLSHKRVRGGEETWNNKWCSQLDGWLVHQLLKQPHGDKPLTGALWETPWLVVWWRLYITGPRRCPTRCSTPSHWTGKLWDMPTAVEMIVVPLGDIQLVYKTQAL